MTYKYIDIWNEIRTKTCAEVTVHEDIAPTLIQGVKRTKSAENVTRSKVGLIPWSKLVISQETISERTGLVKIQFKLLYDTRL